MLTFSARKQENLTQNTPSPELACLTGDIYFGGGADKRAAKPREEWGGGL